MSNITIKQIAKALNLSVSTISKALNDSYEISIETKKIVKTYAKEHNYRPNRLAKSLKGGSSNVIGVVVCSINNIFVSQILEGIQMAAYETDYEIMIMQSHENILNERQCIESLIRKGVDGILLAPVSETSNSEYLNDINNQVCPIIFFDRINPKVKTIKIGIDEEKGSFLAITHLSRINRKKILFVTGDQFGDNNPRILGYKKALEKSNISFNQKLFLMCNLQNPKEVDEFLLHNISQLMKSSNRPNAIFGATGVITLRILGVLAQIRIKVPEDIAVIGFSNFDMPFALNPPLSSIRQPTQEIGFVTLKKMVELLETDKEKRHRLFETILLDPILELRKSTSL